MQFQFDITPKPPETMPPTTEAPSAPAPQTIDLLRQILEVQREQLALQKQAAAAHDTGSRWRAFLSRWQQDFPELPDACRHALPMLERAYSSLIADLADYLQRNGSDALDNEFTLAEFLDRYGMRLSQLGTIQVLVAMLAEAANANAAAGESSSGGTAT
jgi:hypothetical protein